MVKAKNKRKKQKFISRFSTSQKVMLAVIILAMLTIIIGAIASVVLQPENQIKAKTSALASDYYENYLYTELFNSPNYSGELEATLSKYKDTGTNSVSMRQLLLHDYIKNSSDAEYLNAYCDEDKSYVIFYPEEPYGRTDYHIDYHYICNY